MKRIGFGYDIHPLSEGRDLVLGGVVIPFNRGLAGHSDADVLCHAIMDALLGAAARGDIGMHFPDDDPRYEGASSIDLLRTIGELLKRERYRIINIDATIVAEAPKIQPFNESMVGNLSQALGIKPYQISVKATTNEGFGDVGEGSAIAVYAISLISKMSLWKR